MGLLPTNGDEKHAKGRMPGERSVAPSVIFNRAVLAALAAGILLAMYWLSIRPNLSPELRDFWAVDADRGMTAGLWFALIFCVAAAIRAGLRRDWPMIVCLLPCLLLAASGALGWYPVSHRTRLFALPCFTLAVMMTVEDLLRRWSNRTAINVAALALAIGIAGYAASAQVIERRAVPEEDFAAAVRFLESHVRAGGSRAGACVLQGRVPPVFRDGRLESAARSLRRYGMAMLRPRQGRAAGALHRTRGNRRSGREDSSRLLRPDLAPVHHPAHALELCRHRRRGALAQASLGARLPAGAVLALRESGRQSNGLHERALDEPTWGGRRLCTQSRAPTPRPGLHLAQADEGVGRGSGDPPSDEVRPRARRTPRSGLLGAGRRGRRRRVGGPAHKR